MATNALDCTLGEAVEGAFSSGRTCLKEVELFRSEINNSFTRMLK